MSDFKYNIIGCIEKYTDFKEAEKWLIKAQHEMQSDEFWKLTCDIFVHFLARYDFSTVEKIQNIVPKQISKQVYEGLSRYYKKLQETSNVSNTKNFKSLILDCIKQKPQDFETAKYWFVAARREIQDEEYQKLTNDILEYFLLQHDFSTAEKIRDVFKNEIPLPICEKLIQHHKKQVKSKLTGLFKNYLFYEAEQFYKQNREVIDDSEYNHISELSHARAQFVELANKYNVGINRVVDESGPTLLAKILTEFEEKKILDDSEVGWLKQNKLSSLLGTHYYQLIKIFGDVTDEAVWSRSRASGFFRDAGMSQKAIEITDGFSERLVTDGGIIIRDFKASGAVYTSRGGAFRDLRDFVKAKECANKAIILSPVSYYPYNLLGGISYDEGRPEEGDRYFVKATELGSPPRAQEAEIRGVLQNKSTNIETRKTIIAYLLKKDQEKYAWVKRFQPQ